MDNPQDRNNAPAAAGNPPPAQEPARGLFSIWEDDMVEKFVDDKGKPKWKCLWCNKTFGSWSATKALYHVSKVAGKDVRACSSRRIDDFHQKRYSDLLSLRSNKRDTTAATSEAIDESITQHNNTVTTTYDASRKKARHSSNGNANALANYFSPTGSTIGLSATSNVAATARGSVSGIQLKITDGTASCPSANSLLTMAISDLIHSRGLPFSLASDPKFQKMLVLAKNVTMQYRPPGRNQVAGPLLDLNYDAYMEKNMNLLVKDADVFGISLFGDGATVKKKALLNVLGSGVHLPSACLEIVDCTSHLEAGGKKDGNIYCK